MEQDRKTLRDGYGLCQVPHNIPQPTKRPGELLLAAGGFTLLEGNRSVMDGWRQALFASALTTVLTGPAAEDCKEPVRSFRSKAQGAWLLFECLNFYQTYSSVWKPAILNTSEKYPNDLYIRFGRQVKHLRNLRKLTQSQLAEASGLSVEFISLVERGRSAPSLKNIFGLSQALRVPVCAFFLFATDKTQLPDDWQMCAVDEQRYYLAKTKKMKILIVDDNHSFRESASDFLNMVEWIEVAATAESAEAARPLMTNHNPDVVLLDIGMPGLNGLDFAAEIRQSWPGIHIIFLTALDSPAYREKSVTLGAQGFVKKTDMMEQLVPLLESLS